MMAASSIGSQENIRFRLGVLLWEQRGQRIPDLTTFVLGLIYVNSDPSYQTDYGKLSVAMPLVRMIGRGNPDEETEDHPRCPPILEKGEVKEGKYTIYCDPLTKEQRTHVRWILLHPPQESSGKFTIKSSVVSFEKPMLQVRREIVVAWVKRAFRVNYGATQTGAFFSCDVPSKGGSRLESFMKNVIRYPGDAPQTFGIFCIIFAKENDLSLDFSVPLSWEELNKKLIIPLIKLPYLLVPPPPNGK